MTGYHIRVGYNSNGRKALLWPALRGEATAIADQTDALVCEVMRLEPQLGGAALADFAGAYRRRDDLTITFKDEGDDADDPQVMILASGGGPPRGLKEACARAFVRLLMNRMHARKIEISVVVA